MTSGSVISWLSPRSGFLAIVALTGLCLAATLAFALLTTMTSYLIGFVALTAILAAGSGYAWWDWKHPPRGPSPPLR